MANSLLMVTSSAAPGQDVAYNDWYRDVHAAEMAAIPGVVSLTRYQIDPGSAAPPATYLAVIEVEPGLAAGMPAEIRARLGSGQLSMSDALDRTSVKMWLYHPM